MNEPKKVAELLPPKAVSIEQQEIEQLKKQLETLNKRLIEAITENQRLQGEMQVLNIRLDEHRVTSNLLALKGAKA